MTGKNWLFLKWVLAILVGEIALVFFTTIAQEVLYNGISYRTSSTFELIGGGAATFIASVLAGFVASLVLSGKKLIPLVISILIAAETTALVVLNKTSDPLWFDFLAGGTLILGVWLGYLWGTRRRSF
ncbi:MAG: hypothetical protein HKN76_05370 [Saprospiraceae bacterium]|nr:hypothetical protein [Saprospiraceae bacterium]